MKARVGVQERDMLESSNALVLHPQPPLPSAKSPHNLANTYIKLYSMLFEVMELMREVTLNTDGTQSLLCLNICI